MVVSPEAVKECSKDAPEKPALLVSSNTNTNSGAPTRIRPNCLEADNNTNLLPTDNGRIQIKVFRDNEDNCDKSGGEVVKQPSYVSLARCISGYTLLTTYDSKQREGFRSRDISPVRIPLPVGMNPSSYQGRNNLTVTTNSCSTSSTSSSNINNSNILNTFNTTSNSTSNVIKSPAQSQSKVMPSPYNTSDNNVSSGLNNNYGNDNNVGVINIPRSPARISNNINSTTSMESKGCSMESETTSSFVLQRVERLYGPGALAQGFFARHSSRRLLNTSTSSSLDDSVRSVNGSPANGNNNLVVDSPVNGVDASTDDALPVLKLLRPEFRAQLSVARHKLRSRSIDKVDGTSSPRREHIIPILVETNEKPSVTSIPVTVQESSRQSSPPTEISSQKNGRYFLQVVHGEMEVLQRLADNLQSDMATNTIPEELDGRLRSAIGKARLLVSEKLRQFEGLCHKNISQDLTDNFRTTDEDLAGFWDMVSIQVDSVHNEFDQIRKLKENSWKQLAPVPKTATLNKSQTREATTTIVKPRTNNNNSTIKTTSDSTINKAKKDARDEARRKLLQERRMAMKKSMSANANQDQVFIP